MLVLIDNYDSFTYNLYYLIKLFCEEILVIRNDAFSSKELEDLRPLGIVISPGPGRPEEAKLSIDAVKIAEKRKIPLLGVCLGHQVIGRHFGAVVMRAPEPVHGKTDRIFHHGRRLFKGCRNPFKATRYHSLVVARETVCSPLRVTAWNHEGLVMAVEHETLPIYGVQFHPESFLSEEGESLMQSFIEEVKLHACHSGCH
jgi:anthranilate synthase component 2